MNSLEFSDKKNSGNDSSHGNPFWICHYCFQPVYIYYAVEDIMLGVKKFFQQLREKLAR